MKTCDDCGEEIVFAKHAAGGWLCIDPDPTPDGNIIEEGGRFRVLGNERAKAYDGDKYIAHQATCEKRGRRR